MFALLSERLLFSWGLIAACVLVTAASLLFDFGRFIIPLSLTYIVIALGTTVLPSIRVRRKDADYSYGIYVWGFLIQQIIETAFHTNWLKDLALALPLTVLIAAASWHFIEEPPLQFKRESFGRIPKVLRSNDTAEVAAQPAKEEPFRLS